MSLSLPDSIWSREDLKAVVLEIQAYHRWFTAANIKQQVNNTAKIVEPPNLSPAAVSLVNAASPKGVVTELGLSDLLSTLQGFVATNPEITITLAAPPSGLLKKNLIAWCRGNIAPEILVNFRFNATLLGGMVIQYGSRIYDWSFRRQILENRVRFPEVLRHV